MFRYFETSITFLNLFFHLLHYEELLFIPYHPVFHMFCLKKNVIVQMKDI
jgi:hypothetical protein